MNDFAQTHHCECVGNAGSRPNDLAAMILNR